MQTTLCSECTRFFLKQPQLFCSCSITCFYAADSDLANSSRYETVDWEKVDKSVRQRLAGSSLVVSFFSFKVRKKIGKQKYAQVLHVTNTLHEKEQKLHLMFKKKLIKYSIDIARHFNVLMRVLYYHDDDDYYDYSCAILVYCCLNVTLFFYDMLKDELENENENDGRPLRNIKYLMKIANDTQRVNVTDSSLHWSDGHLSRD